MNSCVMALLLSLILWGAIIGSALSLYVWISG